MKIYKENLAKYSRAINLIGKALGESKYDDAMMGAMLPKGELSAASVLSLLYNVDVDAVEKSLHTVAQKEFDRLCNRLHKK